MGLQNQLSYATCGQSPCFPPPFYVLSEVFSMAAAHFIHIMGTANSFISPEEEKCFSLFYNVEHSFIILCSNC